MTLYTAAVTYGGARKTRKFYSFSNAAKWLYSHAVGQYFIDGVEYDRAALREAMRK